MHLTFKNPSNPFQVVNIGKISDSYSISFVTSTTLDNYIVPAQFLDGHLDQDYFGYPFLKGFVRGFISSQIPPTVNTDNKTVADSEQVGVVDSVGDALSFVLPVQNKALKNVSFVRLEHDVIATWNAFACVAFYKFPIEYFSYLEDFKSWHKFIRFIEDKAIDVSQTETIKHFVRAVLYPQNSLSCQDFDNINDALLCAMHQMPHRFNEFQAIQSKILSVFPFLPEYFDTVLDDDIPPCFKGA